MEGHDEPTDSTSQGAWETHNAYTTLARVLLLLDDATRPLTGLLETILTTRPPVIRPAVVVWWA